jgi:hypothetical protein
MAAAISEAFTKPANKAWRTVGKGFSAKAASASLCLRH